MIEEFYKERDKGLIDAVVNDNWDGIIEYSKKWGIPIPDNKNTMKAGIYKAVQYCTEIPQDVKELAAKKCIKLGYNPFIQPYMDREESE